MSSLKRIFVTKPGKMGSNSPFMEMELAIGHKSSRNAEKNAKKQNLHI